ncbi:MAG: hypothetical protein K0S45_2627 [Nitrospira sp.]|jgi:hypothetical protein|nr:hypothetical protein [Nitrospira sp.]
MSLDALRQNDMMAYLIDALQAKKDIGHYGRLVFAMVARHFLPEPELVALLQLNPGVSDHEARSLCLQVQGKDYSPPRRERILEWQKEQRFPICPNAEDPDACNVYKDLKFPSEVYEHIAGYYEGKVDSSQSSTK